MRLENAVEESDYTLPTFSKIKWTLLVLAVIIFGFMFNFSFTERVEHILKGALNANPRCPISYKELKLGFFFPKAILNDVSMPGRCAAANATKPIEFSQVNINLIGFSFSPFGPNLELKTTLGGSNIRTKQTIGPTEQIINTQGTTLNLKTLLEYLGSDFKLQGQMETNALVNLKNNKVNSTKFLLKSKDLFIPSQRLQALDLPNLNLKNFSFKGVYDNSKKIRIESLIIGDDKSPIRASFKGDIWPNEFQFAMSRIELTGEVIFSEAFLESFSIVKMLFQNFPQRDGYYQVKLGGTIGSPSPQPQ